MIGCHVGRGARIHVPPLVVGELHVLQSHEKSRVELLLLFWSRHDAVVGGELWTIRSIRLIGREAGMKTEDTVGVCYGAVGVCYCCC